MSDAPRPTNETRAQPPTERRERLRGDEQVTLPPEAAAAVAAGPVPPGVPGYEILGTLGRGGMGVVYQARQLGLNRTVALKMILAGGHAGEDDLARFRAEAETVARLQHPHIVQIYEVGECAGQPYFSLEYCGGGSLAQKLDGAVLPPAEAARLVECLARALHAAHARNIVHRDLKPGNVLLAEDGTPKVTDFGLAKKLDAGAGRTITGTVMGTPSYMAPEQAGGKGAAVGPAADVYALGAILYECLTGRPPFKAATTMDTLMQVVTDDPVPPTRLQPKTPADVETICLKCLHKDPARRYATAEDLAEDLRRFLAGEPIRARPVHALEKGLKWVRRRPAVALLGAVSFLALLSLALGGVWFAWQLDQRAREAEQARDRARDLALREAEAKQEAETARDQAADLARKEAGARQDADRQRDAARQEKTRADERLVQLNVANGMQRLEDGDLFGSLPWFTSTLKLDRGKPAEELDRIRVGSILRYSPRLLQAWESDRAFMTAAISPDGRLVATASAKTVVWDTAGGARVSTVPSALSQTRQVTFSPDGKRLLTVSSNPQGVARVCEAATGKWVSAPVKAPQLWEITSASFSPDGRRFLTTMSPRFGPDTKGETRVWDATTGAPLTPPLKHEHRVNHAAFSPDGSRCATADGGYRGGGVVRLWEIATGNPLGPPLAHRYPVSHVSFSPDGSRLVSASGFGENGEARIWDARTGAAVTPPLKHRRQVNTASFSPDGRLVVTATGTTYQGRGEFEAWILDPASGKSVLPPLRHRAAILDAAFTPDGRFVVTASADRTARVWDLASGEAVTPPLLHPYEVNHAAFSPNGRLLLTVSGKQHGSGGAETRLWDVAAGPEPRDLGPFVGLSFSPDGNRVLTSLSNGRNVFSTSNPETDRVRLLDVATGRAVLPPVPTRGFPSHASFSPDGRYLATACGQFTDNEPVWGEAQVWEAATGKPVGPALPHGDRVVSVTFSPEGRRLLTVNRAGPGYEARVWDVATGLRLTTPFKIAENYSLTDVCFSPDGKEVISVYGNWAAVWDAATGKPGIIFRSAAANGIVYPFNGGESRTAFSPDGKRVALGFGLEAAQVLDWRTGQPTSPLLKHQTWINRVVFSPDGMRLATASDDGTARVWDAQTGAPVTPPLQHLQRVLDVGFSPDGRFVVTGSADQTARVWEARTGLPLTPPLRHVGAVDFTRFRPDGRRLFTASSGLHGRLYEWDLSPEAGPLDDLQPIAQLLGCRRIDSSGELLSEPPEGTSVAGEGSPPRGLFGQLNPLLFPLDKSAGVPHPALRLLHARDPKATADWVRDLPAWHARQAAAAEAAGQWYAAGWHLDQVLAEEPRNTDLYQRRAALAARLPDWDRAAAALTRASQLAPGDRRVWWGLARAHAELKQWDRAFTDFNEYLGREPAEVPLGDPPTPPLPGRLEALRTLAYVQHLAGRTDVARETCHRLLAGVRRYPDVAVPGALLAVASGNPFGLATVLPGVSSLWGRRGEEQYQAVRCAVLLGNAPGDPAELPRFVGKSDAPITRGAVLCRQGRFEEAVRALQTSQHPVGWLFQALAEIKSGKPQEARKTMDRVKKWLETSDVTDWDTRLEMDLLTREVEGLLRSAKQGP